MVDLRIVIHIILEHLSFQTRLKRSHEYELKGKK